MQYIFLLIGNVCLHSAELKAENGRVTKQGRSKRYDGISGVHMKTIIFVRLREVLLIFPACMSTYKVFSCLTVLLSGIIIFLLGKRLLLRCQRYVYVKP